MEKTLDMAILALSLVAGLVLGGIFFGGLWWTIRRGVASARPWLWFGGSLILRLGVALGGFYYVSGGEWQRLLACLLGFLLARLTVIQLVRAMPDQAHYEMPIIKMPPARWRKPPSDED